jgi:hypothetical protein
MTRPPAIEWLNAEFANAIKRYGRDFRAGPGNPKWHGPSFIRPMIQLRSVFDCKPMRVRAEDYDDPERWWL